ncbi:MAG: hypothetical protein BGO09_12765 [Bacteroidetes bacterium 47-18]|nr:MAG: hypothetical protein BGO09_12765 [Bacteroidetes bacterium 47-18]
MSTTTIKEQQLRKHKSWATGLFILMTLLYIAASIAEHNYHLKGAGYIRAFSEAAMVGALADWFAVTALFAYPLGLKIPHTNIIQRSKDKIGENLGSFVVDNFLNAETIKPYIRKLEVTQFAAEWLLKEKNLAMISSEVKKTARELLTQADGSAITRYIARQGTGILSELDLNTGIANLVRYFAATPEMDDAINSVAGKAMEMVAANRQLVQQKVKENSFFFIPGFVDNKIADKISSGIISFLADIRDNPEHETRLAVKAKVTELADAIQTEDKWQQELQKLRDNLIRSGKVEEYAASIWQYLRRAIDELLQDDSTVLETRVSRFLARTVADIRSNPEQTRQIDGWIRSKVYYYVLRNAVTIGNIISATVEAWDGRELSRKLELEVGKDLQFIRINGTLVGGLVGLLIYTVTRFFLN